jgi:universal stress protein A
VSNPRVILVAVDFSPCSRAALVWALGLGEGVQSIDVLYVSAAVKANITVRDPTGTVRSIRDYAGASALRELENFISTFRPRGSVEVAPMIEIGTAAQAILDVAARKTYDTVVIGAHSHGLKGNALLGSVAERVAREAPCPVITVSDEDSSGP